ncbi:MAG: adenylate/guanylate cyclase domain-containing protein [Pseudomonadota bacterium]
MSDPSTANVATQAGERRQITAVFMDIVGFSTIASTTDPEDLQEWLEEFYAQARGVVNAHDGEVTEYLGDGIVALFGLHRADELAASKAVRAAMAALETIDTGKRTGTPLQLRIGIATGDAAVRAPDAHSSGPRATGAVTTLAQRIQERAAPGTVMIAQNTQALLRGRIATEEYAGENLRGFAETQSLFRPLTDHPVVQPAKDVFVGRVGVLQRIRNADNATLLVGPAGIGKTAVAQQLAIEAAATTFIVADMVHTRASYQPFTRWIQRQTGRNLPEFSDLTMCFPSLGDKAQQALALILGLPEGQPLLTERSNLALKPLIEDSIWQAMQAVQPTGLLVFEDLHWFDNASLSVLAHILQSKAAQSYKLLITSREGERVDAMLEMAALHTIRLGPLSSGEATQMLNALSAGKIAPHQRSNVIDHAAGIPLFIEQLFQRDEAQSRHRRDIPGSLKDLLAEQIDMTGAAKPVLQCAAVIGQQFDRAMLDALATQHGPLGPHLEAAQKQGVLHQVDDDTWRFAHALLRNACYDGMLRSTRKELHAQMATHLQQNHADAVKRNPALLTEHLSLSQQHIPAIQNYLSVSKWALFQGAFADAENHVLAAITLCNEAPQDVETEALEIACYTALGSIRMQTQGFMATPVKEAFDKVAQLSRGQRGYSAANGPAFYGSFSHALILADKPAADQFSDLLRETAANDPAGDPNSELRLASLNVDTSLHFYTGQFDQASGAFHKLRDHYDIARHGAMIANYGADTYAAAQMFEGAARAICGDAHLVPDLIAETDAHQDRLNIPVMQPWALIWGAVPLYYAGQLDAAIARVRRGLKVADQQTAAFWQVTGAAWLNVMDTSETYKAEGLEGFSTVIKSHDAMGANIGLPYFRAHYATALAKHDLLEDAYQVSLQAIRENQTNGLHCWYAEVLRLHARICAQRGALEGAARFRKKAAAMSEAQNALLWLLRVRLDQHSAGEINDAKLRHVLYRFDVAAITPEQTTAQKRLTLG